MILRPLGTTFFVVSRLLECLSPTTLIIDRTILFQAEDLLDDILSFEAGSLGDQLKDGQSGSLTSLPDLGIKPEPLLLTDAEIHALAKDRQKKDNHNMSEYTWIFFSPVDG